MPLHSLASKTTLKSPLIIQGEIEAERYTNSVHKTFLSIYSYTPNRQNSSESKYHQHPKINAKAGQKKRPPREIKVLVEKLTLPFKLLKTIGKLNIQENSNNLEESIIGSKRTRQ